MNTRIDRIAAERLEVSEDTVERAADAMIGRELSGIKDGIVALRTLFEGQAVTHTEFRRSREEHLERLEATLDNVIRVEKELYNLQE